MKQHCERPGHARPPNRIASIARCAECGARWWGQTKQRERARGSAEMRKIVHTPRGCRPGVFFESALSDCVAAWLAEWRPPDNVRARIARFLGSRGRDDLREARRKKLEGELDRVRNLYRWGDMEEAEYTAEHRRLLRTIDELGDEQRPQAPSEEALKLTSRIGEAWTRVSNETRGRFLEEWFAEMDRAGRRNRDGRARGLPLDRLSGAREWSPAR